MSKFQDSRGDEWRFAITLATAARIKAEHQVDLLQWQDWSQRLGADQFLLCAVLFACLSPECVAERAVDLVGFLDRLDGDAFERAVDAWMQALTDFFPQRLRLPMRQIQQTITRKLSQATDQVTELETSGKLQALVNTIVDQVLGSSSGGPPAPSASIPDPAPSGS